MAIEVDLKRSSGMPSLGTHVFKITRIHDGEGGAGPYWGFNCECQTPGDDQGKEVFLVISHSESTRWKRDEFLDAVKAPVKGKGKGEDFIGKMFRANVSHDDYEGKDKAGLSNLMPYDSQTSLPGMGDNPPPSNVSTVLPPELQSTEEEDDIPF